MKFNQRRQYAQVALFSLMALGAGTAFAQAAGTKVAGEPTSSEKSTGSKDTKENAIALINKAVDKSKRTSEFTKALENKDNKTLTKLVIGNGAPNDSIVTVVVDPGKPNSISIECCSKKSWGPVIIRL